MPVVIAVAALPVAVAAGAAGSYIQKLMHCNLSQWSQVLRRRTRRRLHGCLKDSTAAVAVMGPEGSGGQATSEDQKSSAVADSEDSAILIAFSAEPSAKPLVIGDQAVDVSNPDVEFDLWVETELQAAWCIEDPASVGCDWKKTCQTSSVSLRWEDFEALPNHNSSVSKVSSISGDILDVHEAFKRLGLDEKAEVSQLASAFRQLSLRCHPDKAGPESAESFNTLVVAYELARQYADRRDV
jgi:hypothetical protein